MAWFSGVKPTVQSLRRVVVLRDCVKPTVWKVSLGSDPFGLRYTFRAVRRVVILRDCVKPTVRSIRRVVASGLRQTDCLVNLIW